MSNVLIDKLTVLLKSGHPILLMKRVCSDCTVTAGSIAAMADRSLPSPKSSDPLCSPNSLILNGHQEVFRRKLNGRRTSQTTLFNLSHRMEL
jgi:hypothetical protein